MQISHTEVRRHPIWQRVRLHEHPVAKSRAQSVTVSYAPIGYIAIGVVAVAIAWVAWLSRN